MLADGLLRHNHSVRHMIQQKPGSRRAFSGWAKASTPLFQLSLFIAFLMVVFLTGGGSRHDILSLIVLRPASVLFLAVGLLTMPGGTGSRATLPMLLIGALAAIMVAQLIPLPPAIWGKLPGRDIILRADALAGIAGNWRPLSLTPGRTINALFSLVSPVAAMVLYQNLSITHRKAVLGLLIGVGAVTILWGLAQLIGGGDSALYTYRVHTENKPIGLFANRNHAATFLAVTILFSLWYLLRLPDLAGRRLLRAIALFAYIIVVILVVFILGSRAGLLLCAYAVVIGAGALFAAPWLRRTKAGKPAKGRLVAAQWLANQRQLLVPLMALAGFLVLGGLAWVTNRGEAFARLTDGDAANPFDRSEVLPYLLRMAGDHWLWGSGFGSFDALFRWYEGTSTLSTTYLNQAHNDWLQIVMEGGVPATLVVLAFMMWLGVRATQIMRTKVVGAAVPQAVIFAVFGAIGFASLVDYPLRVPAVMVVMSLVACLLTEADDFHAPAARRSGR